MEPGTRNPKRRMVIVVACFLFLAALPTFASAAEKVQNVIIANNLDNPVPVKHVGTVDVSGNVAITNLPQQQIVQGRQVLGTYEGADTALEIPVPEGKRIILTDVVATVGHCAEYPAFIMVDSPRGELARLYPHPEQPASLHLETGLDVGYWDLRFVLIDPDCAAVVLWTGYMEEM